MKLNLSIVCMLLVLVVLTGCNESVSVETSDTSVNVDGGNAVVETDLGTVKVTASGTDSWCAEGSTVSTDSSDGSMDAVIEGIVSSGKYAGYCHMVAKISSQGQDIEIDYYYDEDGSGYQVMEVAGQTMETAWQK